MGWPQSQDYNEAIQNAKSCFKDAELSKGAAVTNPLGMPLPCSGNFADVYQIHCPETKTRWAVKCFTRGDPKALEDRYAKIDQHLQQAKLPFAVGFRYLVEGIRIRKEWHPILKMQWVEGFTLNHFVRDNLDKPNVLDALLQIWVRMGKRLREADMAHADLQHGNVMLVAGSTSASLAVKLIDYDGMWVPALEGKKSGEVGHPAYQHTKRLYEGTYSKEVDRFPLLVVATALRCLRVAGRPLWEKFDNGDNLLFREADLAAPERSPLFAELNKIQDPQAQKLVGVLLKATTEPLEDTPPIDALLADGSKKSASAGKPASGTAPLPEAAFADLDDPQDAGTSAVRRGRDHSASGGKKWATIGGGVAAALLATVLIILLASGGKNEPDPDGNNQRQGDNSKDDGLTTTTPPAPLRLTLADLADMRLQAGESKTLNVQLSGHNGLTFQTQLSHLPPGVTGEKLSEDARNGRAVWRLTAKADADPGEKKVNVTASAGKARTQTEFQLTVARAEATVAPPTAVLPPAQPGAVRKELRRLEKVRERLMSLAFSADNRQVFASGFQDRYSWYTQTGTAGPVGQLTVTTPWNCVLADGRVFGATPRFEMHLDDPQTRQPKQLGSHSGQLLRLAVARNGKRAISSSGVLALDKDRKPIVKDGLPVWEHLALKVWDLDKGKELWSLPNITQPVIALAVSADGKTALSVTNRVPYTLVRWDLDTGKELGAMTDGAKSNSVFAVALAPDGKRAAVARGDRTLQLWDCEQRQELLRFGGASLEENVYALVFSDDGRFLLTGGGRRRARQPADACRARLWDVATGKQLLQLEGGHTSEIQVLNLSPDGRRAVTFSDDQAVLWDLALDGKSDPPPSVPPPVAEKRKTPPTEQEQATALANLKQVFADEYAKAKPTDRVARLALADLLLLKAREIKDNTTDRYVLIREAADLYQQLGAAAPLLAALDVLAEEFNVERIALKEKALLDVAKLATPAAYKAVGDAALVVMEDARDAEDFEALTRLADFAEAVATKSLDVPTRAKVNPAVKEARDLVKDSQAAKEAEAVLKANPDDATANLVRGKFLCFRLGTWQRGLPLLAKGEDAKLKELAARDTANPDSADERVKLADSWFDLSKTTTAGKGEVLRRAAHWYGLALDSGLTALNKERVEKQLKAIEPQLPPSRAVKASGEIRKSESPGGAVVRVAYFPDGSRIVTNSNESQLRIWDVRSGKEVKTARGGGGGTATSVTVGPDGSWIASTWGGSVVQWTDVTGTKTDLGQALATGVKCVAYVGKTRRVIVATSEGMLLTVEEGGADARSFDYNKTIGAYTALAACNVGSGLALVGTDAGVLWLYSLAAMQRPIPQRIGTHGKPVTAVALTADGTRAVSVGEDKTVRVWDVKQSREVRRLVGHSGAVTGLSLSADGRRVATSGEDGTVRVWDLASGQELRRFVGHKGKVNAVAFSPDGRRLASAGDDGTIRIWGF